MFCPGVDTCPLCVLAYSSVLRPFSIISRFDFSMLRCSISPPITELVDCLYEHTVREGWILIEDSEAINLQAVFEREVFYGTHLPGLFSAFVRREYLCDLRTMYPIKHSFASFPRGVLFDRPVGDCALNELQAAFDLFNVCWFLVFFRFPFGLFSFYGHY